MKYQIDNTPVAYCKGCLTTSGRMGCYIHGLGGRFVTSDTQYNRLDLTDLGFPGFVMTDFEWDSDNLGNSIVRIKLQKFA